MKLNKKVLALLVLGGLSVSGNSMAGTASAEALANTCAGCHGIDGSSTGPAIPSIAEMSAEYFNEAMLDYQTKDGRVNTIMTRIAKGYSEEEINLMAGYFAKKKMARYVQKFDAEQAKTGKKLHDKYCEKCHEDGGRSAEDDAGILAGQWTTYLHYTMDDYIEGRREMTKKMKKKVKKAMKADADAMSKLINYYGSQY